MVLVVTSYLLVNCPDKFYAYADFFAPFGFIKVVFVSTLTTGNRMCGLGGQSKTDSDLSCSFYFFVRRCS